MSKDSQNYAQKQRLAYIDFKLLFTGFVTRAEVVNRFELGLAAASRDLALYKELAPGNMEYSNVEKKYLIAASFKPLYEHDSRKSLLKLAHQISDGLDAIQDVNFPVESPAQLNVPDIFVIARLSQAIINQKAVNVIYTSLSSGSTARELVPHSIVDNGLRWHLRAFDRRSQSFRDFVLTRIAKASVLTCEIESHEEACEDHQWQRQITLQLVAHPNNVQHPTAIEMDFGMTDGVLELNVRAAMAGYLLRRWNVDCSSDASLDGQEYQLYLRNHESLFGAENLLLAPGYQLSDS